MQPEPGPDAPATPWTLRGFVRDHPWWTTTVVLVLVSAVLVRWAGTRPSYDAYGWLVWGYQTLRLHLDLGGAPSWKPLPYLFTVPYALAGHYELFLWMVTAVALGLAGGVFGGRIAHRVLTDDGADPRVAWAGALFAGAAVLALEDYTHYIFSVQSDPIIVALVLAAVDAHLGGRRRWAFWLGVLAGLGRPEAWCMLGPYTLYLWWTERELRTMLYAGWALIAFMWFGVPTITNGRPFVSAQLAMGSPRELHGNRIVGTCNRFKELYFLPLWLSTIATVAWAAARRFRPVLVLALAAVVWVITEAAFALHGWPALPRYMFEAAALCGVISGIGFGWLLELRKLLPSAAPRWAGWAGPVVALALVAVLLPDARTRWDVEHADLKHERLRTTEINRMVAAFGALGGTQHIRNCGEPVIDVEWASAMAYAMHLDVGFIGHRPNYELHRSYPIVLFTALPNGWHALPWHTAPATLARCSGLHAAWVYTPAHPAGVLVHY